MGQGSGLALTRTKESSTLINKNKISNKIDPYFVVPKANNDKLFEYFDLQYIDDSKEMEFFCFNCYFLIQAKISNNIFEEETKS